MNRRLAPLIALWFLFLAGPAHSQNSGQLIALSVSQVDAGSPSFVLQVMGGNFVQGSTVFWGANSLFTSYADSNDLNATVTSDLLSISGSNRITVQNPNGAVSGFAFLYVNPVLYSVSPTSVPIGSSSQTITVIGSGFNANDLVQVNPVGTVSSIPTTYVSPNSLTAVVPATTLAHASNAAVVVVQTGCCVSRPTYLQIGNPPVIGTLNPNSVNLGASGFFMTVSGSGFLSGAVVYFNGAAVPTTYVNSSQVNAQVPASPVLSQLNPIPVYVLNPDGGTSNAANVTIISPGPVISSLYPPTNTAGIGDFTLTVNGTGFVSGAKVLWNGKNLSTTFNGSTVLTASVPAALTAVPGSAQITVQNPSGAPSAAVTFSFAGPQISALAPSSVGAGSPSFTLAVGGSGFLNTSTIFWGTLPVATTFVSPTQLSAAVSASLILTPAVTNIQVSNSGTLSNTVPFTVAAPVILTMNPTSASAGSNGFTMLINGTGFTNGTQVQWNSTLLPATFLAATQLSAPIPPTVLTTPGTASVSVVNPGGTASNSLTFTLNAPVVSQVTPASAPVGSAALNLTVNGSGFASGSQVQWNSTPLVTNFITVGQLNAKVSADLMATAGAVSISVLSPGGLTSNSVPFTLTSGAPAISTLLPASVTAGVAAFTLAVNGSGFTPDAVVQWNGAPLSTTYGSAAQLAAAVPAALIATAGSANVTVTSSLGSSNAVAFSITGTGPTVGAGGVVNAASGSPSIAPGSLISFFGSNLATDTASAKKIPLSLQLGGASLTINGIPAPLLFAGPSQINAQLPYEVQTGTATAVITSGSVTSAPITFSVSPTGPGLFLVSGSSHAVVQNYADGSLNSSQHPVAAAQYAVVYMTGQGAVDNAVADGAAATASPLSNALAHATATIGGQNATVTFAGLAPGFVGVLQLDIQIPAVPAGDQPLIVTIGGVASNTALISIM